MTSEGPRTRDQGQGTTEPKGELAYRLGPVDVLQRGLEQARALGAPGEMRNRLRLSAEYAAIHAGNLPPWLEFAEVQKRPALTVLREEETP